MEIINYRELVCIYNNIICLKMGSVKWEIGGEVIMKILYTLSGAAARTGRFIKNKIKK